MFKVINKENNMIWVEDAIKSEEYFCPKCNKIVILKKCTKKASHFAHKIDSGCVDWGDTSEWHLDWQKQFPMEYREVLLNNGKEIHRADICNETLKTVIEFQHSNISEEDFQKRNRFYTSCGYKLIWIFHIDGKLKKDITYWVGEPKDTFCLNDFKAQSICWKRKKSTFLHFNNKTMPNVTILLEKLNELNIPVLLPVYSIDDEGASIMWLNEYIYKDNFLKTFFPDKFDKIKSINEIIQQSLNITNTIFLNHQKAQLQRLQQLKYENRPVRRNWHL